MNRAFSLEVGSAPALRVLAGAAGGALLGYGLTRRFPVACLVGTAGLILLGWAVNIQVRRPPGLYGSRQGVDGQKGTARAANKAMTSEMAEETEEVAAGPVPPGPGIPVL